MSDNAATDRRFHLLRGRHAELMATYRQQSELFVKSLLLYFAVVGVAFGLYFRGTYGLTDGGVANGEPLPGEMGLFLLLFCALASLLALSGSLAGTLWALRVKRSLDELDRALIREVGAEVWEERATDEVNVGEEGGSEGWFPDVPLFGGVALGVLACGAALLIGLSTMWLLLS